MEEEDKATRVWNRACDYMVEMPEEIPDGDRKLVHAITIDGYVQGDGVMAALEYYEEHVADAIEALRWFGLHDAAEVLERTQAKLKQLPEDQREELEMESDAAYPLDSDQRLTAGLKERLRANPEAFSPL